MASVRCFFVDHPRSFAGHHESFGVLVGLFGWPTAATGVAQTSPARLQTRPVRTIPNHIAAIEQLQGSVPTGIRGWVNPIPHRAWPHATWDMKQPFELHEHPFRHLPRAFLPPGHLPGGETGFGAALACRTMGPGLRLPLVFSAWRFPLACGGGQINSRCAIQAIGEASQGRSI